MAQVFGVNNNEDVCIFRIYPDDVSVTARCNIEQYWHGHLCSAVNDASSINLNQLNCCACVVL